jgi:hypothetical protein
MKGIEQKQAKGAKKEAISYVKTGYCSGRLGVRKSGCKVEHACDRFREVIGAIVLRQAQHGLSASCQHKREQTMNVQTTSMGLVSDCVHLRWEGEA